MVAKARGVSMGELFWVVVSDHVCNGSSHHRLSAPVVS